MTEKLSFSQKAHKKFIDGAKEHCTCGLIMKNYTSNKFCECWDTVDYKGEAMEECYDLFNYVSKGLSKFNPPEKITAVVSDIYILFNRILELEGSRNGNKTV